jgi:hypothetical protein
MSWKSFNNTSFSLILIEISGQLGFMRLNLIFYTTILPYRSVCGIKDIMSTLDTQNLLEYKTQLSTSGDSSPECGSIIPNKNVLKPSLGKDSLNHQNIENSELLNNKTRLNNNKLTQEDINRARQKIAADDRALLLGKFPSLTPFKIDQLTPSSSELGTGSDLHPSKSTLNINNDKYTSFITNALFSLCFLNNKLNDEIQTLNHELIGCKASLVLKDKQIEKLKLIIDTPKANSSNSGLSPNKDINSAARRKKNRLDDSDEQDESEKRFPGGQPGHECHTRAKLTPEEATKIIDYGIEGEICPCCNCKLERRPEKDKQIDQLAIPKVVIDKIISNIKAYYCPKCKKFHYGNMPPSLVGKGLICDTFISLITMFKSSLSLSISGIRELFHLQYGVSLSKGYIQKVLTEVMWLLRPSYLEILDNVKNEKKLNIDETGTKRDGKLSYLWLYHGETLGAFKIGTRGLSLINSVLGPDYSGTIITDCLSTYISFVKDHPDVDHQLCWAHLNRDIKKCRQHGNPEVRKYGDNFNRAKRDLFKIYRAYKDELIKGTGNEHKLYAQLIEQKEIVCSAAKNVADVDYNLMHSLKKRFVNYPEKYFVFIDNMNIEPTNNTAEINIRLYVIKRYISHQTRSIEGDYLIETILSLSLTAKKKGINLQDYILDSIKAYHSKQPTPSIVNIGQSTESKYAEMVIRDRQNIEKDKEEKKLKKIAAKEAKGIKKANDAKQAKNTKKTDKVTETKKFKEFEEIKEIEETEETKKVKDAKQANKTKKIDNAKEAKKTKIADKSIEAEETKVADEAKEAEETKVADKAKEAEETKVADEAKEAGGIKDTKKTERAKSKQNSIKIKENQKKSQKINEPELTKKPPPLKENNKGNNPREPSQKVKPPGENPTPKGLDLAPLGLSSEHPVTTGKEENSFMGTLPVTLPLPSKKPKEAQNKASKGSRHKLDHRREPGKRHIKAPGSHMKESGACSNEPEIIPITSKPVPPTRLKAKIGKNLAKK